MKTMRDIFEAVSKKIGPDKYEFQGKKGHWRSVKGSALFFPDDGSTPMGMPKGMNSTKFGFHNAMVAGLKQWDDGMSEEPTMSADDIWTVTVQTMKDALPDSSHKAIVNFLDTSAGEEFADALFQMDQSWADAFHKKPLIRGIKTLLKGKAGKMARQEIAKHE